MSLLSAVDRPDAVVGFDVDNPPSGVSTYNFTDSAGDTYQGISFEGVGNYTVDIEGTVDVLVVGGGGGAAIGGGGAGGLVYASRELDARSYEIQVGQGGSAGNDDNIAGNGEDSYFDKNGSAELLALGGGRGGRSGGSASGGDGGSGGGEGGNNSSQLEGTTQQAGTNSNVNFELGSDGGYVPNCSGPDPGGGGGGATQQGESRNSCTTGGDGGDGKDMSSQFGTQVGENGVFAGGGGGGNNSDSGGTGGDGGGGDGAAESRPTAPIPNTGGGAGSSGWNTPVYDEAQGASGTVIIRYQI